MAPLPGRFLCPWARSGQEGYKGGGNKFDLERWDEDYFKRFRDFVIMSLGLGTALREHEIAALNVGDILLPDGAIRRRFTAVTTRVAR